MNLLDQLFFVFLGMLTYRGLKWLWLHRETKKSRRRQFIKAYRILRDEAERHKAAGHNVEFIAVNESRISLYCHRCPDLQPPNKKRGLYERTDGWPGADEYNPRPGAQGNG